MFRRWILFRPDEGTGDSGAGAIESAPERPAWLPEKFENPEAFASSYAEAEKELKRLQQETAKQEREFADALQRIESSVQERQQPVYQPGQDPLMSAAQRAWDEGDIATFMAINAQVSQAATAQLLDERLKPIADNISGASQADRDISFRLAEQQVAPQWGDRWGEIAGKVNDLITANPALLPSTPSVEGYAGAISALARQVDYDRLAAAQNAADQERAAKLQAQTLGSGTARVATDTDEKKAAWDEIKGAQTQSWNNLVGG